MEIRKIASNILFSESVEEKLSLPMGPWTDNEPGEAVRVEKPARHANLLIRPGHDTSVPPIEGMHDPEQRGRILHALVNHEFQAVELFAWALLAFTETPAIEGQRALCRESIPLIRQPKISLDDPLHEIMWQFAPAPVNSTLKANSRFFCMETAEDLGCQLEGTCSLDSLAELETHLSSGGASASPESGDGSGCDGSRDS